MPLAQPLADFQQHLRDLLVENPADALKALQAALPPTSEKYATAATLLGELNDTNKQRLRGILSNDDLQRAYNRLRAATLDLIDTLDAADFEEAAPRRDSAAPPARQGEILYRVPSAMPLQRETRCTVRIALDAETIVQDMVLDEHVTLKPLVRVSDVMQVELLDPSADGVFRIRTLSSAEQLVEDEGYTEWLFYVMPLVEGTHALVIKVAVIELALGKERKKEIVLEENVVITADAPAAADDGPLKPAGERLVFHAEPAAPAPRGQDRAIPPAWVEEAMAEPPSAPGSVPPAPVLPPMPSPAPVYVPLPEDLAGSPTGGGLPPYAPQREEVVAKAPPPVVQRPSSSPLPIIVLAVVILLMLVALILLF
jgi:hypothetical protein